MALPTTASERLLNIALALNQYPILASRIRESMRQELYKSGVIDPQTFNQEVTAKAIQSQEREGLHQPTLEEAAEIWEHRKAIVADQLTDYYFSKFLTFSRLNELIQDALTSRGVNLTEIVFEFNPETAPADMLFNQGMMIEKMFPTDRLPYEARLREIKVVLIRSMISDQLRYINIAKDWFTISDLAEIRRHKFGQGKIGGKAAGMLLATRILKEKASDELKECLRTPESFYLGADLYYTFLSVNNLMHWNDQKYKDEDQMRHDHPLIVEDFVRGEFAPQVAQYLETILSMVGQKPLIVRSSSLLEDNFGTAFAGKYESIFLANQSTPKNNLRAFKEAIARIYASTLNPGALLYRRSRGLIDYDERMALLIQTVEGEVFGDFYFPQLAGVAFSHNQYRWSPQIRVEDGFLRLVWGLGTRAVDRVGNDYPRLVALSHPTLRPSSAAKSIRRYSQQYIDLIDLKKNAFLSLPVHDVLEPTYKPLRYLAQLDQDGYFQSLHGKMVSGSVSELILTFEDLLRKTTFADQMRELLRTLQKEYFSAVDVEFTGEILENVGKAKVELTLIQCRPLSYLKDEGENRIPATLKPENKLFSSSVMVAGGKLEDINYVVYVPANAYFSLPTQADRFKLERAIGKLNTALAGEHFICVGPGRWGTSNPDLGVHVDYADIFNARALVELSGTGIGPEPEPSLGTHFFQDLLEGEIFPLSTHIGEDIFCHEFFETTPNHLEEWLEADPTLSNTLRLIRVNDFREGHHLELVMDGTQGKAMAFLAVNKQGLNEYSV